jgi:hypothetical protein
MRRRLALGALAMALCWAPSAAQACTISVVTSLIEDPDDPLISAAERRRRTLAMRAGHTRAIEDAMKRLRAEARQGLGSDGAPYASALVASMVPSPVRVGTVFCRSGLFIRSPDKDYDEARDAVKAASEEFEDFNLDRFANAYARRVEGCGDELHRRLAGYVAAHIEVDQLARVWSQVHRLGFDRSRDAHWQPLFFRYDGPGFDLKMRSDADVTGYGSNEWDHRLQREISARLSKANWARMSRFLSEDRDAQELVAVLEQGLAELSDDTLPYRGLCPETTRDLRAFVAQEAERARPRRPTVRMVAEEPPSES